MARYAYLNPAQFTRSNALVRATLGGDALTVLLRDQRGAISLDLREGVGDYTPVIPYMRKSVLAIINTTRIENFTGDKARAVETRMNFGGQVIYSSEVEAELDLRRELQLVKHMLEAVSTHGVLHRYRRSFKYWVGGRVMDQLPPNGEFAIGGIVNTHSYAPKVECRLWFRIFRQVWSSVRAVRNSRRMDVRIRNLQGVTEVNQGRAWPSPVIEIGYLNSMNGKTGNFLGRQRCRRNQKIFDIG